MKQQQLDRNITLNLQQELPKIPPLASSSNDKFLTQCSKASKKQSNSPVRIKQFLKLFKHSDSNTRILKISPYCNTNLKNKIINALQSTKRGQRFYYPLKKTQKEENMEKSWKYGQNQGISTDSCSYTRDFSIVKLPKKGETMFLKDRKNKIQTFIGQINIQIQEESIDIQVTQDVVNENFCLSAPKIIEQLQLQYRGNHHDNKINCIVGFCVVGFQRKRLQRNNEKIRKSLEHQPQRVNDKKGLLESSSYLLSVGKLNPRQKRFQTWQTINLKPIYPKRIKQFISWKVEQSNRNSNNNSNRNSSNGNGNGNGNGNSNGHNGKQVLKSPEETQNKENGKDGYLMKNILLSDFDIIKCLGSGGFSTVFLVRANFNAKYYAMKVIDKKFIMDTERDGIVQNQRFILQTLSRTNTERDQKCISFITELSFSFETCNHFIFILEYCPGGQLFNQLKKVRKMSEDQAKFYFLQILIAIDYIHSHNVIYRDLKPENLLIDADGHIKIADFGLSKPLQNFKSPSYSFCGSPQYMAPEMLMKSGHNHLLDYYCLGALLYELVIGVPPYYSLKQEQIYESILTEQLSFPKHVYLSTQIMNLLSGLLKKDPKQRLGSLCGIKQIMCHPWFGRISRSTIQNKQLKPPFVPDLNQNNFDAEQIKANVSQIMEKLKKDAKDRQFQTHFSEEFVFINKKQKLHFLDKYTKSTYQYFSKTSRRSYLPKSSSVPYTNRFGSPYICKSLMKQREKQSSRHWKSTQKVNKQKTLPNEIKEGGKRKMKSQKSKSRKKKMFQHRQADKENVI